MLLLLFRRERKFFRCIHFLDGWWCQWRSHLMHNMHFMHCSMCKEKKTSLSNGVFLSLSLSILISYEHQLHKLFSFELKVIIVVQFLFNYDIYRCRFSFSSIHECFFLLLLHRVIMIRDMLKILCLEHDFPFHSFVKFYFNFIFPRLFVMSIASQASSLVTAYFSSSLFSICYLIFVAFFTHPIPLQRNYFTHPHAYKVCIKWQR